MLFETADLLWRRKSDHPRVYTIKQNPMDYRNSIWGYNQYMESTYTPWIFLLEHLTFEINHWNRWVDLLISEITGNVLDYPVQHKKKMSCFFFFHFPPIFQISWYLVHKTGLNQIAGIYWQQKTTFYVNRYCHISYQWPSTFCEMLYQTLGAPRPSIRQYAIS